MTNVNDTYELDDIFPRIETVFADYITDLGKARTASEVTDEQMAIAVRAAMRLACMELYQRFLIVLLESARGDEAGEAGPVDPGNSTEGGQG